MSVPKLGMIIPVLGMIACSPCHSKHEHVRFVPQHEDCNDVCFGSDETQTCVPFCTTIPDKCVSEWWCDVRCDSVDKGKLESHGKHQTLIGTRVVDSQCR